MPNAATARFLSIAVALAVPALAAMPTPATAGELRVATCQADQLNFSSTAFTSFAGRGMEVKRACDPDGSGLRGMVTRNAIARGTVRRGAVALASIDAPPGTVFTSVSWAGEVRRRDCAYALQLYATTPAQQTVSIKNVRAHKGCPHGGTAQAAGYRSRTFNIPGATRIVQRVICEASGKRKSCSARGSNYIRTYRVVVGVADTTPPTVAVAQDTPLAQGAWVNGIQAFNYAADDNLGVLAVQATIGDRPAGSQDRPCALASPSGAFATGVPCPSGPGTITVDTSHLPEGTLPLAVSARDPAGNVGAAPPLPVRIDNTPPGRVDVMLEGGDAWRNSNDFGLSWTNPVEPDRAPIVAATTELCAAGSSTTCRNITASGPEIAHVGLHVPAPGEWTATLWRTDAAGNQSQALASTPVTLRYDPEPPKLAFADSPPGDPTTISVPVTDEVSGLADGSIEMSAEGSATWTTLPTHIEDGKLVAHIDDTGFPAGRYVLRATAHDRANNQGSTTARQDGSPMQITLPLRIASKLTGGVLQQRTVEQWVAAKHGKRKRVRHQVTEVRVSAGVRLGAPVQVVGRLTDPAGGGIPGAQLQVLSRSTVAPEHPVATLTTDPTGAYSYSAVGTTTETLSFVYAGSPTILPSRTEVGLGVPADATIGVDRKRVLNGASVTFGGAVRTLPIPAGGKLVELQVYLSKRWQTFRTIRTDPSGAWSMRYQFKRTRGLQRFRFRARLPKEAGYPFGLGASPVITVVVRGQAG